MKRCRQATSSGVWCRCTVRAGAAFLMAAALLSSAARGEAGSLGMEASYWDYGSLCDPKLPSAEPITIKALEDNVHVHFTECARLEKKWGNPVGVRLHLENAGAAAEDVHLPLLSAVTLQAKGAPRAALGMLLRQPDPTGAAGVSLMEGVTGQLAFSVAGGKAIDLVFFFADAQKGDQLAFGEAPPTAVEGEPPVAAAPLAAKLKTTASLFAGSICEVRSKKPGSASFTGSFSVTPCSKESGKVVLVEIANAGGKEGKVTLHGLGSIALRRRATGATVASTGFGLPMPNPVGSGFQTNVVTTIEGEISFPVPGGESIELLIQFPRAAAGDKITVGDAPPARIR